MAISAPIESGSRPDNPFLIRVRAEGGTLEVAVEGDVDQTSLPALLDEIRHAAGLVDALDQAVDEPASPRRLRIDLTGTPRLEAHAVDELMALVHELETDDLTVGIVRG